MKQPAPFLSPFLAALLLIGSGDVRSQTAAPPAEPILQKMAEAYLAAQTYSDKNTAVYRKRDGSEQLKVDFKVWFARPGAFRVDAESRSPGGTAARREVLWADGAVTRTWATGKAVTSRPKVQLAGSGMFGTYAYHVPTLLEPSYGARRRLHELTTATVSGEELFEGVDCYRIRGQWDGDAYEVWVGKTDHLVRRIVATYADHQLEEIHREIVIDAPIPKETFRFAPEDEAVPAKRP
ncbi:MAG: DUF2092 domain-containing protein [Limisphaerales bacterium]